MADQDKMLDRVRALLNKAESTEFPEEAEELSRKAAELMARYGIDAAMAAAREDKQAKPGSILIDVTNPYALYKDVLLNGITKAFGCHAVKTYRFGDVKGGGKRIHVFGFEADLRMVQMLYTSLLLQGAAGSLHVPRGESARSYRVAYWFKYANTVCERVRESRETAEAESTASTPGTALVLVSRDVAVKSAARAEYPNLTQGRSRRVTVRSLAGYAAGEAQGRSANIHSRPETGGAARAALS